MPNCMNHCLDLRTKLPSSPRENTELGRAAQSRSTARPTGKPANAKVELISLRWANIVKRTWTEVFAALLSESVPVCDKLLVLSVENK